MPDELRPDDIPDQWREEPRDPVRMSLDAVRRRARQFEARTRRGFHVMVIMMIGLAAGYSSFLYFFPGTPQRIGASLTLAAYVYCAYQFRRNGPVKRLLAQEPATTSAAFKAELERLRDFPLISKLMAPFIPGPAVFVMGFLIPEMGLWKAIGLTALLIASPSILIVPLVRRHRQMLEREIRSLDALME